MKRYRLPIWLTKSLILIVAFTPLIVLMFILSNGTPVLQTVVKIPLDIPEPSDIAYSANDNTFYLVSDRGSVYQIDQNGEILRKSKDTGGDWEAVTIYDGSLLVTDEFSGEVILLSIETLDIVERYAIIPGNSLNRGLESIVYNPVKGVILAIAEKDPVRFYELDGNFRMVTNFIPYNRFIDISGATWHENCLWVVSDQAQLVYRLDPTNYRVLSKWRIPSYDPEGIAFDSSGKLAVVSDTGRWLTFFEFPLHHK